LRAAVDRVLELRREVTLKEVAWPDGREGKYFKIVLLPLFDDDGVLQGTSIAFADVTPLRALQNQLKHSRQEVETAYEELQSTNEELETTNEELQSTVEELETTNEELQSTNEELETMNEELQSTNEELQTTNDELRNRGSELSSMNLFLESVFAGLRSAVVVIDHEYRVQVWNHRAEDLWGVRAEEVNHSHFLNLDIGLPVAELRPAIRSVLGGAQDQQELTVAATSRRGKPIACRITVSPLRQENRAVGGAILLMEERSDNP
jgi:two-component system CheB/CheR fusion protein